jgi:hypothetical protein
MLKGESGFFPQEERRMKAKKLTQPMYVLPWCTTDSFSSFLIGKGDGKTKQRSSGCAEASKPNPENFEPKKLQKNHA